MVRKSLLSAAVLLCAMFSSAYATILQPGATNQPPDILTAPTTGLLASITGTINPGTFTVSYTEWVYSDSNNTFCANCLDFVYQFTNTGTTGVVERVTGFDFGNFQVDAGYQANTGQAPQTVDRSNEGAGYGRVVGFNFPGNDELKAGSTTSLLIIETDARNFGPGLVSAQDGSAGTNAGFGPTAIPEPVSLALLGSGLALLGLGRLRRRTSN